MSHCKWLMVPLGEVVKPVQRPVTVEPGTPYRTLGVKWWGEGAYERQTIDGSDTAAKTLNRVAADDLIINKIWVRHGSVAVVSTDVDGCFGSGEFPTFEFDQSRLLPGWMHWYSKTRELWQKCDILSQGTSGKNRIRPEAFLTVPVPIPTVPEQQRIVARIDRLAEKIDEARRFNTDSEATIHALQRSAFAKIIDKCDSCSMKMVAPLIRRPVSPKEGENYSELGVRSFGKGTFHKPSLDFMSVGTKKLYRIEPGDLVFSNVFAWEGAIAVAKDKDAGRVGSHRFITCVPVSGVATSEFICFYFLTPEGMRKIGEASPGGAGRNRTLGLSKLEVIKVPIPPIEEQVRFGLLLQRMRIASAERAKSKAALDAMMPSILDRAFKGEL